MASKNSISVGIKVRPILPKENNQDILWKISNNSIQLEGHCEPFCFDHIFGQDATNQAVFDSMAKHIVHSVVKGFNGTIFAYGQTSSGKTYTMMGDDNNPGVMVLAAKEIFKEIEKTSERLFCIRVEYCEIYNEKVNDLLNKKNQDLKIHENATTGYVGVNCEQFAITCEDDLLSYLCLGNKERTVGETNMNERSSRSHAIFRIIIESHKVTSSGDDEDVAVQSILNLVDLAGSERADQTGAQGKRLKEGGHINKSLLFLSNVIKQLSENLDDKYVSFRDSKLTRLLQASLGGNALTSIICTIKPTVIEETQSTLSFAMRARRIKNKPKVNEVVSDATHMKRLEREIKRLTMCLEEERKKNISKAKVGQLEERLKQEHFKIVSSNSLHTIRSLKEKRRRTWCSSSQRCFESTAEGTLLNDRNPLKESGLRPPKKTSSKLFNYFTPNITLRNPQEEESKQQKLYDVPEEHWESGDQMKIEQITPPRVSPKSDNDCFIANENDGYSLSLTPKVGKNMKKSLDIVESELRSLQDYTNLENKIDVEFNVYNALKEKLNEVCKRNTELEQDRREKIFLQNELLAMKQDLASLTEGYEKGELKIAELTKANAEINQSIENYKKDIEKQNTELKELRAENQEAISLQFELDNNKKKARLRESELLSLLDEKDKQISKLQKSLETLNANAVKSRKSSFNTAEKKCTNCKYFEDLLKENEQAAEKTNEVMQKYKELELSHQKALINVTEAQKTITLLEQRNCIDDDRCKKLQTEIDVLRKRLEQVQEEYRQLNDDMNEKTAKCEQLHRIVEQSKADMLILEQKNDELEQMWLCQKSSLVQIQTEFNEVQSKYQQLLDDYRNLEKLSAQSSEVCQRLQCENKDLQIEIGALRLRALQAQQNIMQCASEEQPQSENKIEVAAVNAEAQTDEDDVISFEELQRKHDELQNEYDDLSNQLMDSLQEAECLKIQCEKLQAENESRDEEIKNLKLSLCTITAAGDSLEYDSNSPKAVSECDSAICDRLSKNEFRDIATAKINAVSDENVNLLNQFHEVVGMLHEIELQFMQGKYMCFRAVDAPVGSGYKMQLKNLQHIICNEEQIVEEKSEKTYLQGILLENFFKITELAAHTVKNTKGCQEVDTKLEQELQNLRRESDYQKKLLASSEENMAELKQQIQELSRELFEKSLVAEKCDEYQKRIENLEKENAEMTLFYNRTLDESVLNEMAITDSTIGKMNLKELEEQRPDKIMLSKDKLIEDLQQQCEELSSRCQTYGMKCANLEKENDQAIEKLQTEIERLKTELLKLEKHYKKECDEMQLEFMAKLDLNEIKFRECIGNYNKEWENQKQEYEDKMEKLVQQLKEQETNLCCCKNTREQLEEKEQQLAEYASNIKDLQIDLTQTKDQMNKLQIEKTSSETRLELLQLNFKQQLEDQIALFDQEQKTMHEEIAELKAQLEAKNRQLETTADNVTVLEKQLKEVNEEKVQLVRKLFDMQSEHSAENLSKELADLKAEKEILEADIALRNASYEQLKRQLSCNDEKLSAALAKNKILENDLLTLQNEKEEKVNQLSEQMHSLEELERLRVEIESLKLHYEATFVTLQNDKLELEDEIKKLKADNLLLQEKEADYLTKLDSLQLQLHKAEANSLIYNQLLMEHEQLEVSFKQAEAQIVELQSCNLQVTEEIKQLQGIDELYKSLKKEVESLQSCLKESAYKLHSIKDENEQLSKRNKYLMEKVEAFNKNVAQCEYLREQLEKIQTENSKLQNALKQNTQDTENSCRKLTMQMELQKKTIASLESKESNYKNTKNQLEGTISCLLSEKQNLEEKLHAIELVAKKLETELQFWQTKAADSSNNSSGHNFSGSAQPRVSFDRLSIENTQGKKMFHDTAERKNRRLSTHDERRRQTCWKSERDVATMTDPFDENCACAELDQKLQECKENLYVRECQLVALKMQIKANPLKNENAELIKRVQDEQLKFTTEQKRFKHYVQDLKAKLLEKNECLENLEKQLKESCKNLQKEQQNHETTKASLASQKEALEKATAELFSERQKYKRLEKAYSHLQEECNKANAALAAERQNADITNAAMVKMKAEVEEAQACATREKRNCDITKIALAAQKQKLDDAFAIMAKEKRNYESARLAVTSLQDSIQKLTASCNKEKAAYEAAKAELRSAEEKLASLQNEYSEMKMAYSNEKLKCEEMAASYASTLKQLNEVRKAYSEIKVAYANQKQKLLDVKYDLGMLKSNDKPTNKENSASNRCQSVDTKSGKSSASADAPAVEKMSYEKLEGRYNDLLTICTYRRQVIKSLECKISELQGDKPVNSEHMENCMCKVLESKYGDLEIRYKYKAEKCSEFESMILKQNHEIASLRSSIHKMKTSNCSKTTQ